VGGPRLPPCRRVQPGCNFLCPTGYSYEREGNESPSCRWGGPLDARRGDYAASWSNTQTHSADAVLGARKHIPDRKKSQRARCVVCPSYNVHVHAACTCM